MPSYEYWPPKIKSCVFIRGLQERDSAASLLLDLVGAGLILIIPRLVAQEVTRNLGTTEQVRSFYRMFHACDLTFIVDEPVPRALVTKCTGLDLPAKADAFIGAFAEWLQVRYLVSDNRHFLRDLQADAFEVFSPEEFMTRWQAGTL